MSSVFVAYKLITHGGGAYFKTAENYVFFSADWLGKSTYAKNTYFAQQFPLWLFLFQLDVEKYC